MSEIGWTVELSLRDDNTAYFNFNGKEYFGTWSPSETDNTKGSLIIGENDMNIWMEGDMLCFTIIAEDTNATFYMKKMN
ncbi:MAG: hypothetical protein PUC20_01505 [Firmicutes bacterium]|nr:hypothetical protein [Bacillota bacterium]